MKASQFWHATGLIALANGVALALQFLTTVLLAREFGASAEMDAYTLAVSIPEALQILLMFASLSFVFTPLFIDARAQHGETEAWSMALSLLVIILGSVIVLIPLLILLMPTLMYLLAPGLALETRALAVELGDLILPGVIYYATAGLLLGICYAYRDFVTPALNTLLLALLNLCAFFVFVQFLRWGVRGMIVGRLVVLVMLAVFLLARARRHKHNIAAHAGVNNRRAWHLLTYLPPYMFGAVSWQIELFITRSLISTLGAGSVAAWGYGQRLSDIPMALLGAAVGATYLPDFATNVANKNLHVAGTQWNRAALQTLLLLAPIAALLIALGAPFIALLFQRGAFDAIATQHSAAVLAGLIVGLPLRGVGGLLVRGMPAFKTRTLPLFLSALSTGATVLGAFAFIGTLGLFGVALAASVGDALFAIVGTGIFWRWLQSHEWQYNLVESGKIMFAATGAGMVAYLAIRFISANDPVMQFLLLAFASSMGLATFFLLLLLLRVRASRAVLDLLLKRLQHLGAEM